MNRHVYTFENIDNKVTIIKTSSEMTQEAIDTLMDSFGLSCSYSVESVKPCLKCGRVSPKEAL